MDTSPNENVFRPEIKLIFRFSFFLLAERVFLFNLVKSVIFLKPERYNTDVVFADDGHITS